MTAFRAVTSGTQTLSSAGTELVFGTETFDPDNAFASNRFTVPAGWNGRVGQLWAGLRLSGVGTNARIEIQRSTDSGSTFPTVVAQEGGGVNCEAISCVSKPISFTTGDIYRVVAFTNTSKANNISNFFSGCIYPTSPTETQFIEITKSSNQSVSNGGFTKVTFDGTSFNTDSLFDDANDYISIPSVWTTAYAVVTFNMELDVLGRYGGYIQLSTNGGSTWAAGLAQQIGDNTLTANVHGGVFELAADDLLRFMFFNNDGATRNVQGSSLTRASAFIFR